MVLGYTLRSMKFEAVEEEMIKDNVLPLIQDYYVTFRNSTSVISSINFLQLYLSVDLGFSAENATGE